MVLSHPRALINRTNYAWLDSYTCHHGKSAVRLVKGAALRLLFRCLQQVQGNCLEKVSTFTAQGKRRSRHAEPFYPFSFLFHPVRSSPVRDRKCHRCLAKVSCCPVHGLRVSCGSRAPVLLHEEHDSEPDDSEDKAQGQKHVQLAIFQTLEVFQAVGMHGMHWILLSKLVLTWGVHDGDPTFWGHGGQPR